MRMDSTFNHPLPVYSLSLKKKGNSAKSKGNGNLIAKLFVCY